MHYDRAERIRDVLRYVRKFNNKTVVIHIDDTVIDSPLFLSHINDISLLHEAGLQLIIIPGSRQRITDILDKSHISWKIHNGFRITDESAIPLIKMAAFDTANRIMTSLSGERKTALIGNWVKARGKGIIDGVDYGTCGEIAAIECESIESVLQNGCIPIFPCIGWSHIGKPYNISSIALAAEIATSLKVEKLFFITNHVTINSSNFKLSQGIQRDEDGKVYALTVEQAQAIAEASLEVESPTKKLLETCAYACAKSVVRSHIVDGNIDGVILSEIFSDIGQGTMIYKSNYGSIRPMIQSDIPLVLSLMHPAIEKGLLLERSEHDLLNTYTDYVVYEMDGGIKACAALHSFSEKDSLTSEIAGVVVDENFSRIGIGPNLISYLIEKAKSSGAKSVFILTTQTADWFESLGFAQDSIENLPEARKNKWDKKRASKVFRLVF